MKLKALVAMCKQENEFRLYDRVDKYGEVTSQWLGTSGAIFPLYGLPYLTEDNLITMFDITEKQREKIFFSHDKLPPCINFSDAEPGETMLEREMCTLGYNGHIIRPIVTRGGLEFIDVDHLTPLVDIADMLELYERRTDKGNAYFVAKVGLLIVGVIMPMSVIEEKLVANMEALAARCRAALRDKTARAVDIQDADEPEQDELEVDQH